MLIKLDIPRVPLPNDENNIQIYSNGLAKHENRMDWSVFKVTDRHFDDA